MLELRRATQRIDCPRLKGQAGGESDGGGGREEKANGTELVGSQNECIPGVLADLYVNDEALL